VAAPTKPKRFRIHLSNEEKSWEKPSASTIEGDARNDAANEVAPANSSQRQPRVSTQDQHTDELEANARAFFAKVAREQGKHSLAKKILHEDSTQLSHGPGQRHWFNPDDRLEVRSVLLLVPRESSFANVLTDQERAVWDMYFDPAQFSLEEVAQHIGGSRWTVSRTIGACVKKLNGRYRELLESGQQLPLSVEVVLRKHIWNGPSPNDYEATVPDAYEVFSTLLRAADSTLDSPTVIRARKAVGEIARGTPGGLSIRGGRRARRTFGKDEAPEEG